MSDGVGDLGQRGVGVRDEGGEREYGGDAERDARRHGVAVEPERHPRQDDDQRRRDVDLDQVVAETTHEQQVARQPRVVTFKQGSRRQHTSLPSLPGVHHTE